MTGLQFFVLFVFTIGNLALTLHNRSLRYPAPKSRREQIAQIKAHQRRDARLR